MHVDECNFLLALDDYDLAAFRPHAPGYPLFVAIGRALRPIAGDGLRALEWANGVAAGVAAFAVARTAALLFGAPAGRAAALLAVASPLAWSYGFGALSYPTASAFTALALWRSVEALRGRPEKIPLAAALLGAAGAIRPMDALFVSLPLVWASLAALGIVPGLEGTAADARAVAGRDLRRRAAAVAFGTLAFAAVTAAWLAPVVASAGGWRPYRAILTDAQTVFDVFEPGASYAGAVGANLAVFVPAALLAAGFAGLLLIPRIVREIRGGAAADRRALLLALWGLPGCLYFVFLHQGQLGYWLPTAAPPLWIGLGAVAARALAAGSRGRAAALAAAVAADAALVLGGGLVAGAVPPAAALAPARFYLERYTAAGIARRDRIVVGLVEEIRGRYRPAETWIFTSGARYMDWSAPLLMAIAPEFSASVAPIDAERLLGAGARIDVPAEGRTVLLLHDDLGRAARPSDRFHRAFSIGSDSAWEARAESGETLRIRGGTIEIAPAGAP